MHALNSLRSPVIYGRQHRTVALVLSVLYLIGKFVSGSPPGHSPIGATTGIAALHFMLMLGICPSSNTLFLGAGDRVLPAVYGRHTKGCAPHGKDMNGIEHAGFITHFQKLGIRIES
jgi:hypothetical protein